METAPTPQQSESKRRSIGRRMLAHLGRGRGIKTQAPVEPAEPRRGVDAATERSIQEWTEKAERLGANPDRPERVGSDIRRHATASYQSRQNLERAYIPGVGTFDPSLDPFAQTSEQQPATPGGPEAWKAAERPAAPQYEDRSKQ